MTIKYIYKGVEYETGVEMYMKDGYHRYQVHSPDGIPFVIGTFGFRSTKGKIIWLQSIKDGEIEQPLDLAQVIGEALEAAELYLPDF